MRTRFVLLAAALLLPLAAQAQEAPAVSAAKAHFQTSARHAAADLSDLSVVDSYLDRRTGATHVYLSQRHAGVDVYGTVTAAAVRGSKVFAAGDAFQSDLAARANDATPSLSADAAVALAEAFGRSQTPALAERDSRALADDAASDAIPEVSYRTVQTQLVYQPTAGDALRLAWAVELQGDGGPGGQQLWMVRVDAQTGAILAADDLVVHDHFGHAPARTDFAPTRVQSAAAAGMIGSYRVIPFPFESPAHGPFTLVADPDDADASPFGWHDTNGAAGSETTNTTGANAFAYTDTDANNSPDAGSSPDGGSGLVFDFPFDETQSATAAVNRPASVVNTFYWTNVFHDILWQYGFDEPSGNFQFNNYGRGGSGNDPVNAEALDGSGLNNANFSTPSDGSRPRMQMFEWTGVPTLAATEPADVAGTYPSSGAQFGTENPVAAEAIFPENPEGGANTGCTVDDIDDDLTGKVAFISRGDCSFVDKARSAQDLGAVAVVVYNCEPGPASCSETADADNLVTMACPDTDPNGCSDVGIPSAFVGLSTKETLEGASSAPTVSIETPVSRDSDFDSGVIAHEIGHGVSNRLTGGRFATGCLSNQEQMGEGWSDYLGLMVTMQNTDTAEQRRGIATYLEFEPTTGQGIRPTPYSTDRSINDVTYADVISGAGTTLSVPHGVGYAWASVLWDMTWALIDQDGFGDVYDADGGFGNQKAMQLVVEGMKLQPCSPGFVSGRDAIFAADELLYDNAHYDLLRQVFASRGLGLNADEGSTSSANDGTADFTEFPPLASETDAAGQVTSLLVSGQNPFRTETAVTLEVSVAQDVTVDVVDLLGRRVATLFDGEVTAGSAKRLAVSADGLPSGVYVIRATGETFSLTERVTITR